MPGRLRWLPSCQHEDEGSDDGVAALILMLTS